jgi:phage gpG-like protein
VLCVPAVLIVEYKYTNKMPQVSRLEIPDFKGLGKGGEDLFKNLPDIAAIAAINFFQDRFDEKGWIDKGGLEKWEDRKAKNANGSLMLVSGFLKGAFDYETGDGWCKVTNYAPYASAHNDGAVISHPGGTPYVIIGGKSVFITKKVAAEMSAKGKKVKKTQPHLIKIPQRQFMGHSEFFMKRMELQLQKQFELLEIKTF